MTDTQIVRRERVAEGEVTLAKLGDGWEPWKYQVSLTVDDGKHYGNPGKPTRTSVSNHEAEDKAIQAFEWMITFKSRAA